MLDPSPFWHRVHELLFHTDGNPEYRQALERGLRRHVAGGKDCAECSLTNDGISLEAYIFKLALRKLKKD